MGGRPSWIRINQYPVKDTKFQSTDLFEGKEYEYRIIAENKVGQSQPSVPCQPFTAKNPWKKPGPPGAPDVSEVTKRSCVLQWTPPENDGGSPITNYVIEYREKGLFKWQPANLGEKTRDTWYKCAGLKRDGEYEFRIAAENKAGVGDYSEGSTPVTAKDPVCK